MSGFEEKHQLNPPDEKVTIVSVTGFSIIGVSVIPYECATVSVRLFGTNEFPISTKSFTMGGADYEHWASDDSYLVSWTEAQIRSSKSI